MSMCLVNHGSQHKGLVSLCPHDSITTGWALYDNIEPKEEERMVIWQVVILR